MDERGGKRYSQVAWLIFLACFDWTLSGRWMQSNSQRNGIPFCLDMAQLHSAVTASNQKKSCNIGTHKNKKCLLWLELLAYMSNVYRFTVSKEPRSLESKT